MYREPPAVVNDVDTPASIVDSPQYLLIQEKTQYLHIKTCCYSGENGDETL